MGKAHKLQKATKQHTTQLQGKVLLLNLAGEDERARQIFVDSSAVALACGANCQGFKTLVVVVNKEGGCDLKNYTSFLKTLLGVFEGCVMLHRLPSRGKKYETLDLASPAGAAVFEQLEQRFKKTFGIEVHKTFTPGQVASAAAAAAE